MRIITDSKDLFLRTVCKDFDFSNPVFDPEQVSSEMLLLMLEAKGLGLASTQVGLEHNVFVIGHANKHYNCFNPKIITEADVVMDKEGCLSFPLLFLNIKRFEKIHVSFQNEQGKEQNEIFEGIWSRCFQHELDHLRGIIFTDHISRLVLDQAKRKRMKLLKEIKRGKYNVN